MSHSLNKIWIHAIWATKFRAKLIHPNIEEQVFTYLKQQLQDLGCTVRIVNGMPDHVHSLFLLNRQKSIAEVIKQIKGSTSHFINQNNLISEKFAWQTGYAAFSVSESGADKVYAYIRNQKIHHKTKTSEQEYEEFLKLHGLVDT
jgi:REP element-mobilizing transposase RayT